MRELSLRPYNGRLFIACSRADYEKSHKKIFKYPEQLTDSQAGRFRGEGVDGFWTYLVYGDSGATLAHELAHVIFHVFDRCGIDPRDSDGEAFCYMLSQLMKDAKK